MKRSILLKVEWVAGDVNVLEELAELAHHGAVLPILECAPLPCLPPHLVVLLVKVLPLSLLFLVLLVIVVIIVIQVFFVLGG